MVHLIIWHSKFQFMGVVWNYGKLINEKLNCFKWPAYHSLAAIAIFAFVNAIMLLKEVVSEMPRQISGLKWQTSWEPLFQGQINGLKSLHVAFLV